MNDWHDIERFLAAQTHLPLDVVTEIYHAGAPWADARQEIGRMAEQDGHAAGVSVETAAKALSQLCDLEMAHLKALVKAAVQDVARVGSALPFFDIPEFQAIADHPITRDMLL